MWTSLTCLGYASVLALLPLGGLGCSGGESLHPAKGKVMYKGQPIPRALVTLHPKGNNELKAIRPIGLSQDDGTFTLMTGEKEGAPAGEYIVTIICSVAPQQPEGKKPKAFSTGEIDTVDLFGGAYANKDNSKITVTIKAGKNELETFDLK